MKTGPKQHYVQQMLLKPFARAEPRRKRRRIFCFNKETLKSFPQSVKNVAQSRYHYRLDPRFGLSEPNVADYVLTKLEGMFAPTFAKVLQQLAAGRVDLDERERSALIELMVFAYLRTPQMQERLGMRLAHSLLDAPPTGFSVAIEAESEKIVHQSVMLDPSFIEKLRQTWCCGWLVFAEAKGCKFVTSDVPVHVFPSTRSPEIAGTVFMPISPKHAAYIIPELPAGTMPDLHIKPMRAELVAERNVETVANARTWVYSRKNDFAFACDLAQDEPEYFRSGMPVDDSTTFRLEMRLPQKKG